MKRKLTTYKIHLKNLRKWMELNSLYEKRIIKYPKKRTIMKKMTLCSLACAVLAMMSCTKGKQTLENEQQCTNDSTIYTGTIPAADCDGIAVRVALANDADQGCHVTSTYVEPGEEDLMVSQDGTYEKMEHDGKSYYKLTCNGDTSYYLILDDTTLRMVNRDLEEPIQTEGMSYDLSKEQ